MAITRRHFFRSTLVVVAAPIGAAVLARARPAHADETEEELQRFFASDYTYCDATILSRFWRQDLRETKARIGRKIGWKDFDVLDGMLGEARKAVEHDDPARLCPYQESGYTYSDITALSDLWGQGVTATKARVSRKLVWGDKKVLDGFLREAQRKSGHPKEP
ncbi:MAG: hypothetical protein U1F43_04035 [Myxococcota bacterium]